MADKDYVTRTGAQVVTVPVLSPNIYQKKIAAVVSTWAKDGAMNAQDAPTMERVPVNKFQLNTLF